MALIDKNAFSAAMADLEESTVVAVAGSHGVRLELAAPGVGITLTGRARRTLARALVSGEDLHKACHAALCRLKEPLITLCPSSDHEVMARW